MDCLEYFAGKQKLLRISKLIILGSFLLIGLITGCQRGPDAARRELSQLGIRWSQEVFLEAVEDSDQVVVELFLTAGMNPNAGSAYGWTPVMHGALAGHTAVVRLLIGRGANVNARGEEGFTALSLAAGNGHTETVRLLIDAGADIRAKDNDGWTALMYASERGNRETVQTLLDRGAEVNVANNDGDSALILAERNGHAEIAQILRSSGATDKGEPLITSPTPWDRGREYKIIWVNQGNTARF